ncbi:MAG TPA: hypothetical protein VF331_14640 [Polyangiales bacterium]
MPGLCRSRILFTNTLTDAILAFGLGSVEGVVSAADQRSDVTAVFRKACDADARRDVHNYPIGSAGNRCARDDHEFVATVARGNVRISHEPSIELACAEKMTKVTQHLVSGEMAEAIIDSSRESVGVSFT